MEVNLITAAAAFVLGLLSGELRRRSGSLLPAILVHAVFNALAAILLTVLSPSDGWLPSTRGSSTILGK
jgi:membrane protease YdiL (CAAX protease family)